MRILTINCQPDFTWLTSRSLKLEVTSKTIPSIKFPILNLYKIANSFGVLVELNTPDVSKITNIETGYDVIIVGWNPKDYDSSVLNTGGYTYPEKQSNGARLISIRVDDIPVNNYPIHEMMHTLCNFINIDIGDHTPKDFLDMTPVQVDCKTGLLIK